MLNEGTYIDKLEALAEDLAMRLQGADDKTAAGLARQYRETICEIERAKGMEQTNDEIDELISERADGMPGAVREDRSTV
jgi:hypothetical protein